MKTPSRQFPSLFQTPRRSSLFFVRRTLPIVVVSLLVASVTLSSAVELTWDSTTSTADGLVDGGGNWATSGAGNNHWWDGITNVFWTSSSDALFGVGNGAAGTVNLSSTISVANMAFAAPGSGSYIISSGNAANKLNLTGTPTITVSNGISASLQIGQTGTGFTKTGDGTLTLRGTSTGHVNTYSGTVTVSAGLLELNKTSGTDGAINGDLTVGVNGIARLLANNQIVNSSAVTVDGGTLDMNGKSDIIGSLAGSGPVTLGVGTLTVGSNNTSTAYSGVISGTGGLTKLGTGTLTLSNNNTYSGTTTISAGTLALGGDGSLSNSAVINVAAGATFDASARTDAALTINIGQKLNGNGTLNGAVVVASGATLAPGTSAGTLTFNSTLTLQTGSTNIMELNKAGGTNDVARAATSISYGGSLIVNNIGGGQTGGEVYKLFDTPSHLGSFDSVTLPTLGAGLSWTNTLATDGSIAVLSSVTPPTTNNIVITNWARLGDGNFQFSFNGSSGQTYRVWASINPGLAPVTNTWSELTNDTFGASSAVFTDEQATNFAKRFYIISAP